MIDIFATLRNQWRATTLRRQLAGLSDGQLDDLGIHRGQIDALARYCHGLGPRPDSA